MSKVGRNDPCPCGSGKKFKRCCIDRVEAEQRVARVAANLEQEERMESVLEAAEQVLEASRAMEEVEGLDKRAEKLIESGRLEEAEALARRLMAEHPREAIGFERLAQVHEARGQRQAAADEYRRGVALMDELGRGRYCDCCRARMVKAVRRLDPDGSALELGLDPQ